jgi:hypothetical protein
MAELALTAERNLVLHRMGEDCWDWKRLRGLVRKRSRA